MVVVDAGEMGSWACVGELLGEEQCSICRGVGGLIPLWCLSTPKFSLIPKKIVKNSQKYIADPLWFYHISSTGEKNGLESGASFEGDWGDRRPSKEKKKRKKKEKREKKKEKKKERREL